jgi:hypothetical protein
MSISMSSYRRGAEHAPALAKMDAKLQFGLGEKINWFGFDWADRLLKIRCLCCFCLHNNAGSHSKSSSHPHASKPHRRRGATSASSQEMNDHPVACVRVGRDTNPGPHDGGLPPLPCDGWHVVDDDDYNQSVGNPKRKV